MVNAILPRKFVDLLTDIKDMRLVISLQSLPFRIAGSHLSFIADRMIWNTRTNVAFRESKEVFFVSLVT